MKSEDLPTSRKGSKMGWRQLVLLCLSEIFASRSRFVLSTLGLFIGVSSLLLNLAFIRGMEDDVKDRLAKIGGLNIITAEAVRPESPEEEIIFARSQGLTLEDAHMLNRKLDEVVDILPQEDLHWKPVLYSGNRGYARIKAIAPVHFATFNYQIEKGRALNEEDMLQSRQVCVLGERAVKRIFEEEKNVLGKKVTIQDVAFEVVGVLAESGRRSRRSFECLIPFETYVNKMGGRKINLDEIALIISDPDKVKQIQEKVRIELLKAHRGVEDFEIKANDEKLAEMNKTSLALRIVLWCIAIVSLLVSGISIMNIMFATLGERIREIGIRKALGARQGDVFGQFLLEAVLVCFLGSIPGLLVGALITGMPSGIFPIDPVLHINDYLLATGFALLTGFVAGLFPAWHAARWNPVEALRY